MNQRHSRQADEVTQFVEGQPAPSDVAQDASPLLSAVVASGTSADSLDQLTAFLNESSDGKAIEIWLGRNLSLDRDSSDSIASRLNQDVAVIDDLLNRQIKAIIHHPRFQKLEASWRGIKYLHNVLVREYDPTGPEAKLKILDVSWKELGNDFESAWDIQQSNLFYKVYEQEFGQAGGEPFGLLIGDYDIKPPDTAGHSQDDFAILNSISAVAAAAFSPFITNCSPEIFQLSDFGELENVQDLSDAFEGTAATRWKNLCLKEDARFLGLAMPKILMRLPWSNRPDLVLTHERRRSSQSRNVNQFCFQEDVRGPNNSKYLWGGAAFAFAAVVLRSFSRTSWLTDIRGVQRNDDGGGLVTDLPVEFNATESPGASPKISTDVIITDETEKELCELGFIPLCSCYDTEFSAFYSARSIQKPQKYNDELANLNARISSMVSTILCASRFAHYLKKIGRDMVGQMGGAEDIQRHLQDWIVQFVASDSAASTTVKARYPLASANVTVRAIAGKSGSYSSIFHLQPHHEIEGLSAAIRLVTEL